MIFCQSDKTLLFLLKLLDNNVLSKFKICRIKFLSEKSNFIANFLVLSLNKIQKLGMSYPTTIIWKNDKVDIFRYYEVTEKKKGLA